MQISMTVAVRSRLRHDSECSIVDENECVSPLSVDKLDADEYTG